MELRAGYKRTEVGLIPEDWITGKLEEYFSLISYGFTNPMPTVRSGIYMITAADIHGGKLQYDSARNTSEAAYQTLLTAKSKPKRNDILLTKDGSLGRLALVDDEIICINQSVAVIRPNERVEPDFLKILLESPAYQKKMIEDAGGSTIKHIYITIVNLMTIAVPKSLPEQRAIAVTLSDVDAMIASLDRMIVKKRDMKQAAMQELLAGKRRLPGFRGEWSVKKLGELGESLIGLTYSPTDVKSDGLLVLRSSNVFEGKLRFEDNVYVDKVVPDKIIVKEGDILICARNGSRDLIGKCALINDHAEGMTFGAFMAIFRTPFSQFVYQQFQSDIVKRQIHEHLGATINQITNKSMNSFRIPFPEDEVERNAIAALLSDMDAEITILEQKLDKTRMMKHGMMQELLTGRIRLV